MTRRRFLIAVGAAAAAGSGVAQFTATIEGKIDTETGKPASDAKVFLDGQTRQSHREVKPTPSGQYSFEGLIPGRYTLWCELQGYGCIVYPNLVLNDGQRLHRDFHFSNRDGGCET